MGLRPLLGGGCRLGNIARSRDYQISQALHSPVMPGLSVSSVSGVGPRQSCLGTSASNTCGLLGQDADPGVGEAVGPTLAESGPLLTPACTWLTSATAPLSIRRADRSSLAPPCSHQALAGSASYGHRNGIRNHMFMMGRSPVQVTLILEHFHSPRNRWKH